MSESTGNVPESRAGLFVSGRVQGVFFRSSTRKVAQAKGLEGYVRNLADGRVQAVFEGPENDV
ncbi:MAG: acylphosphatase, partial [Planctomycetes bacterium]|nr:acylphosphatase [Planctomycetota bacterium]